MPPRILTRCVGFCGLTVHALTQETHVPRSTHRGNGPDAPAFLDMNAPSTSRGEDDESGDPCDALTLEILDDLADVVAGIDISLSGIRRDVAKLTEALVPEAVMDEPPTPLFRQERDPDRVNFMRLIREHLDILLPEDDSGLRAAAAPSQVFALEFAEGPGPKLDDFRVDMDPTRMRSQWNRAAAAIFAASFARANPRWVEAFVRAEKNNYTSPDLYVEDGFFVTMRTIHRRQRIATYGRTAADFDSEKRNRANHRRWTLFDQRMIVVMHFRSLHALLPLMDALTVAGMSPDSSDVEPDTQAERLDRPIYRRIRLPWRSSALKNLLHGLDVLYWHLRTNELGARAGNWPRLRGKDVDALDLADSPVVSRLHSNCYSRRWYKSLDDEMVQLVNARKEATNLTLDADLQSIVNLYRGDHVRQSKNSERVRAPEEPVSDVGRSSQRKQQRSSTKHSRK
ncbi:hypothetical protein AURDEDRAFT_131384 [Auricularia subglabra TFB-10046 SS5]|uniref:Uncharacterized protein n=1 Tax=Auricularia subglabra (strain TFB-10046 / SS5) TaxID=717982 RepID=J0CUL9_AURST|nr:hypothetical protein AURDEDRAFT_131384 [Auricularia subglabra TFB-10046 SS5]